MKYERLIILMFSAIAFFALDASIVARTFLALLVGYVLWGATSGETERTKDTVIV